MRNVVVTRWTRICSTTCNLATVAQCAPTQVHSIHQYVSYFCNGAINAMDVIRVNKSAITAVEDYLEYRRIVGEDDGGILFTSEQYAAYKQQVLPTRLQNRLYVSCGVPGGMDCKLIGPETLCFCSHRYKQHQTDFEKVPLERPLALPCRVSSCSCTSYSYIHLNGSQPVRCRCKHSAQDHSEAGGRRCRKCSTCAAFYSPYTCSCGQPSYAHKTLVETKEERLARGMPVGQDVPYVAMGGLTGFSSLAEGFLRLENRRQSSVLWTGTGWIPILR
ncbi:protein FAM221A isoform X2 [Paramormyrops kingsleyae]|uniref:protein FAM221A isoform X2 n=1 Tax=Paramormyrops kingsleyae TaxID=1676925 RepID=UPI003B9748B2